MKVAVTLSSRDFDAALFDLDGMLTRRASVHAAAWKKLFDAFLEQRATKAGTRIVPIRERDGAAPPITLCVDGEVCEFVSGTTRVFRLKGDATNTPPVTNRQQGQGPARRPGARAPSVRRTTPITPAWWRTSESDSGSR
jgi:hypothetical protein